MVVRKTRKFEEYKLFRQRSFERIRTDGRNREEPGQCISNEESLQKQFGIRIISVSELEIAFRPKMFKTTTNVIFRISKVTKSVVFSRDSYDVKFTALIVFVCVCVFFLIRDMNPYICPYI